MIKKNINIFFIFSAFFILIVLILAFGIEYVLGHKPCKLCLYQRIPYLISILFLGQILFLKKYVKISLLVISLIFAAGAFLAFYHFGIEQGFYTESSACGTENFSKSLSKEQLLEQLKQTNISCKNVRFKIMGLSLAAINTIFSITLSLFFSILFFNYKKNYK